MNHEETLFRLQRTPRILTEMWRAFYSSWQHNPKFHDEIERGLLKLLRQYPKDKVAEVVRMKVSGSSGDSAYQRRGYALRLLDDVGTEQNYSSAEFDGSKPVAGRHNL